MANIQETQGVYVFYKNLGETPKECLWRYKKMYPEYDPIPMTYAGRLDPMAEGLLLVISGDEIVRKNEYLGLSKTYEFEMLWECETDTLDILGLPQSDPVSIFPPEKDVVSSVEKSVGKFVQKYPAYSSQTVDGKSLIAWAREGRINEIEIPSHEVEIFSAQYISRRFISGAELLSEIERRVDLVTGDFRQPLIKAGWQNVLGGHADRQYAMDTIELSVSGGFYVRQFASDLARALGTQATTFHIKRTKIGEFTESL